MKNLVRFLLQGNTSMDLQELELDPVPVGFEFFFRQGWTPCFPKLTVLRLGTSESGDKSVARLQLFEDFIQQDLFLKIVNGAPNLKKINGYFQPELLPKSFPKEKYSLVNQFTLSIESAEHEKICWELVEAKPAMSYLVVDGSGTLPEYRTSFFRILEQLLTSASKTMESLEMLFTVFPLNQLTLPSLTNLKKLEIVTGATPNQVLSILQPFDYPKQLPSLTQVKICSDPDPEDTFQEEPLITPDFDSSSSSSVLQPSVTVKQLSLEADLTQMTFQVMSQIFPAVKELEVCLRSSRRDVIPYAELWSPWPELESVSIIEGWSSLTRNFDAGFLGIHDEELEILRELDTESLEKMHTVPIRPSVLSMPRLKTLQIEFGGMHYKDARLNPSEVFLSKVAGILALRKLVNAGTDVKFVCRDQDAFSRLGHLVPFASVVFEKHKF